MNTLWRRFANPLLFHHTFRRGISCNPHNYAFNDTSSNSLPNSLNNNEYRVYTSIRHKYQKASNSKNDFDEDDTLSKDSKVLRFSTTSMRADAILKSTLGVARNKIEQIFYESRIRVNGKKIMKKSASVREGDEIDVVKSVSPKNPDHIIVSRIEIMNVTAEEESIAITARRFKNLLIENYEHDPFKRGASDV